MCTVKIYTPGSLVNLLGEPVSQLIFNISFRHHELHIRHCWSMIHFYWIACTGKWQNQPESSIKNLNQNNRVSVSQLDTVHSEESNTIKRKFKTYSIYNRMGTQVCLIIINWLAILSTWATYKAITNLLPVLYSIPSHHREDSHRLWCVLWKKRKEINNGYFDILAM